MPAFINHIGQMQTEDNRNISEKYRWWDHERIVEDLDTKRSGLISVFMNVAGDFNLSSGIRNNLWFNSSGVWICGNKKWDRRGTVGSHHYLDVEHSPSFEELVAELREQGYRIVAAEITPNAVPLTTYAWEERSVVIFGEESKGLSEDVLASVDDIVYIPGQGSVRSLNVATTSGIFAYDYSMKTGHI